jgi:hypothetical protein
MSYFLRTIDNPLHRRELFDRLAGLHPGQPTLWGKMTASRMLVHLCDQMRMPFSDKPSGPLPGVPRFPVLWYLALYILPWPKATVQGPPEAFHTEPGNWSDDLATLKKLVDDFVTTPWDRQWPDHPNWGRLSRRQWGFFCYRHFDHHLRQFGV